MNDDLISRQAAIDAIGKDIMGGLNYESILRRMPSAQQWIPCSERLPEKNGNYLVTTVDNITNEQEHEIEQKQIDIAYYADWLKQTVGNNGFHKHAKVVAWMPLPEPYKEKSDG